MEINVHGDFEKPNPEFIDMAAQVFTRMNTYLTRALKYLKGFFPTQELIDYYLSTITFGGLLNFDDGIFKGFAIVFVYGNYPYAFQYKVKLKED